MCQSKRNRLKFERGKVLATLHFRQKSFFYFLLTMSKADQYVLEYATMERNARLHGQRMATWTLPS